MIQRSVEKQELDCRQRSVLSEILRGVKFGGVVAGSIMGSIGIATWCLSVFIPDFGEAGLTLPQKIAGVAGASLLSAVYGAAIGAVFFGVRAAIGRR